MHKPEKVGCLISLFQLNVGNRAIFPMEGHNVTVAQQIIETLMWNVIRQSVDGYPHNTESWPSSRKRT